MSADPYVRYVLVPEKVVEALVARTITEAEVINSENAVRALKECLDNRNHVLHWREADTIKSGLHEGWKAVGRKRSWRPSEKAAAMADFKLLMDKFSALFPVL